MNTLSRTISGSVAMLLGLYLSTVAILSDLWLLIYGIPIIVIGIFIFINKEEDKIEKIKTGGKI